MDGTIGKGGMDAGELAKIQPLQENAVASGALSGIVSLIYRKGEIVQINTVGKRDVEANLPMTRDTIFRIASMTKPITTVSALMLLEEGKLKLDDSITKWVPEFSNMKVIADTAGPLSATTPAARDITIEDLMTHRSGIAYGFSLPEGSPLRNAYETELGDPLNAQLDPSEWMALLGKLPLAYQPGDRFHYGHSTDVLGFIVGRIHGKPFADVLKERIFGPLGMKDTDFWIPHEKRDRAAALYMYDGKGLKRLPGVPYDAPPKFAGGGGGLTSTVEDYIKFAKLMIKNGESDGVRLLKPETVTMMRTNRLTDAQRAIPFLGMDFWWKSQGFGLGLSTIMDPAQHILGAGSKGSYGWPGIFGTWWQADPVEDTILIWLVQNSVMLAGPEAAAAAVTGQAATARMAQPMFQRAAYDAIAKGKAQ